MRDTGKVDSHIFFFQAGEFKTRGQRCKVMGDVLKGTQGTSISQRVLAICNKLPEQQLEAGTIKHLKGF